MKIHIFKHDTILSYIIITMIEDIVNANIERFGDKPFNLAVDSSKKYADFFKKGNTSGDTLGIFFLRDANAIVNLIKYYSGFNKIVVYDLYLVNETLKAYFNIIGFSTVEIEFIDIGKNVPVIEFDKIIMNPPYDKSLHLKILDATIKENPEAEIVNLSPIRWLQDPLAEYKKSSDWKRFENIRKHISSLDVITGKEAQSCFSNVMGMDLGVYCIDENGGWSSRSLQSSLLAKIYEKNKELLRDFDHYKKDGWRVRVSTICSGKSGGSGKRHFIRQTQKLLAFYDGKRDGKWWHEHFQKNQHSKTTEEIPTSFRFSSENEAENFISVMSKTKLGQWYYDKIIVDVNVHSYMFIFLPDYTHPWTDEMLYKYFNLTEDEISLIEKETN